MKSDNIYSHRKFKNINFSTAFTMDSYNDKSQYGPFRYYSDVKDKPYVARYSGWSNYDSYVILIKAEKELGKYYELSITSPTDHKFEPSYEYFNNLDECLKRFREITNIRTIEIFSILDDVKAIKVVKHIKPYCKIEK